MSEGNFSDRSYSRKKLKSPPEVCYFCKCRITRMSGVDVFEKETIDHLQPKNKNGILSKKNKVRSCFKCNQLKGSMTVEEFLSFIESYIKILKLNWKRETNYAFKIKKTLIELTKQKRV